MASVLPAPARRLDWLAIWILGSAACTLAGWVLSLFESLNRPGYIGALLVFAGIIWALRPWLRGAAPRAPFPRRSLSRFWLPRFWLLLTLLALIGGLLYAPVNYDYLTYRFPRVLRWCWEHQWHWIDSNTARMNYSATGFEWMLTPLFVLFQTDRLFFLLNFIPYLFFPGLVFSVFRGLGISPRFCWWWMWVLPAGYCYILQSAGAGNDSIAAIYFLAALHYAFEARASSSSKALLLSCLAIGLTTGIKAVNLPLGLPWLIALVFPWPRLAIRPLAFAFALAVTALVSFLPNAMLNRHFTGDFFGDPANEEGMKIARPLSAIQGNGLQLVIGNTAPPVWPGKISLDRILPQSYLDHLKHDFPRLSIGAGEMQTEESSGLGFGVTAALIIILIFGGRTQRPITVTAITFGAATLLALLVYMAKIGSESTARLLAAYYPPLIAAIVGMAQPQGTRMRCPICTLAAGVALFSALILVVLVPGRPLFPFESASSLLARCGISSGKLQRFDEVYRVYNERADSFQSMRLLVPESERTIGFLHFTDDPEVSLWRPFGSRQVLDVTPDFSTDQLRQRSIHYVIVNENVLASRLHLSLDDLRQRWSADVLMEKPIVLRIQRGPETWALLRCH